MASSKIKSPAYVSGSRNMLNTKFFFSPRLPDPLSMPYFYLFIFIFIYFYFYLYFLPPGPPDPLSMPLEEGVLSGLGELFAQTNVRTTY